MAVPLARTLDVRATGAPIAMSSRPTTGVPADADLVDKLVALGLGRDMAARACSATENKSVREAMQWSMAHLHGAVKEAEMRDQVAQLDARPPSGPCAVASRLPSRDERPKSVRDEIRQWRAENISGPHNAGSGGATPAAAGGVGCTVVGEGSGGGTGAPALGRLMTPRLATPRLGTPRNMLRHPVRSAANMSATLCHMTPRDALASPRVRLDARPVSARLANRSDSVASFTREHHAISWRDNGCEMGHGCRQDNGHQNENGTDHANVAGSQRAQPFSLRAYSKRTAVPVKYKRNAAPKAQEEIDDLKQELATLRAELLTFVQTQSSALHGFSSQHPDTKASVGKKKAGMYYAGRVFSSDIVD